MWGASRGCSTDPGTGSSPALCLRLGTWGRCRDAPRDGTERATFAGLCLFHLRPGGPTPSLLSVFLCTVSVCQAGRGGVRTCGLQSQFCSLRAMRPGQIAESQLPSLSEGDNRTLGPACLPGILWNSRARREAKG